MKQFFLNSCYAIYIFLSIYHNIIIRDHILTEASFIDTRGKRVINKSYINRLKHRFIDQSVITYPSREGVLNLRAAYRGKGYLRLLVENMYNPAQTYSMNLGLVEVV